MSEFSLGGVNLENVNHLKNIIEELMSVAWDPERWQNFHTLENEKKETETA